MFFKTCRWKAGMLELKLWDVLFGFGLLEKKLNRLVFFDFFVGNYSMRDLLFAKTTCRP